MGKIRSWIRERLILAVRYAIREELNQEGYAHLVPQKAHEDQVNYNDEIIQRLDKQMERWTWERYKRTERLFRDFEYDLDRDFTYEFEKIQKRLGSDIKNSADKLGDRIVSNRNYQINETERLIKKWTWERYLRIREREELINYIQDGIADVTFELKKNAYKKGEKIRMVLLYQMPSMWPSWESFYYACSEDSRIDLKVVYLKETILGENRQKNAENFLIEKNIPFIKFEEFDLENYHPHVLFIQTPYDNSQRIRAHWTARIKALGIRLCYIPYGMEITDMPEAHNEQYNTDGLINCWRIYTFSEEIKKEYFKYSLNGGAVRALGLPKFDSFFHRETIQLNAKIKEMAGGRIIILWKLHFPKIYNTNGVKTEVTPDFEEYIKFAEKLSDFNDAFFIFMPHPLFKEQNLDTSMKETVERLFDIVNTTENVYIDTTEDYRNSLLNADGIIIDRSAVMVEAGAVGVPVLFMSNPSFIEPKPNAIAPLIESYYQGTTAIDMSAFVNMCLRKKDPKKTERENAFESCIPNYDGYAGERIKNDIIESLLEECEE